MSSTEVRYRASGAVFSVFLPGDIKSLSAETRRMAAAAILEATQSSIPVHLLGANEPPALVKIDAWAVTVDDSDQDGWELA